MRKENRTISALLACTLATFGAIVPHAAFAQYRSGTTPPMDSIRSAPTSQTYNHDSQRRPSGQYEREPSRQYSRGDKYEHRGDWGGHSRDRDSRYSRDGGGYRGHDYARNGQWGGRDYRGYRGDYGRGYNHGPDHGRYNRYPQGWAGYGRGLYGGYAPYRGYGGYGGWAVPAYGYYGAPVVVAPTRWGWAVQAGNVFVTTAPVYPVYSGWAYRPGR